MGLFSWLTGEDKRNKRREEERESWRKYEKDYNVKMQEKFNQLEREHAIVDAEGLFREWEFVTSFPYGIFDPSRMWRLRLSTYYDYDTCWYCKNNAYVDEVERLFAEMKQKHKLKKLTI